MKAVYLVPLVACGFLLPSLAFAQLPTDQTTLGKSNNTSEDLANSLKPGPQRYGKGEKKSEIDPKTLQSKKNNDKTFSGSLNDIGLDWNGDAMGKPHTSQERPDRLGSNSTAGSHESSANRSREAEDPGSAHISLSGELTLSESDPKSAKQSEATSETHPKATKAADSTEKKSGDTTNDAAEKDQKKVAAKSDEKSKEKSAGSDSDH